MTPREYWNMITSDDFQIDDDENRSIIMKELVKINKVNEIVRDYWEKAVIENHEVKHELV